MTIFNSGQQKKTHKETERPKDRGTQTQTAKKVREELNSICNNFYFRPTKNL
jgi:hypothetical protein